MQRMIDSVRSNKGFWATIVTFILLWLGRDVYWAGQVSSAIAAHGMTASKNTEEIELLKTRQNTEIIERLKAETEFAKQMTQLTGAIQGVVDHVARNDRRIDKLEDKRWGN